MQLAAFLAQSFANPIPLVTPVAIEGKAHKANHHERAASSTGWRT